MIEQPMEDLMTHTGKGKKTCGITRRRLLASSTIAVAGSLAAGPSTGHAQVETRAGGADWDEEFDVVVIGSGFAGLAAAHEAKKAGASVAIFEKMRTAGGNSIINGGVVAAAGSPLQEKAGIEDSPELLLQDMLEAGLHLNHVELARMVAFQSVDTVQWTIDELGTRYRQDVTQEGGHSVPLMYSTYNQSGSAIVTPQLQKLKEMGVQPRTRTLLKRLLRDDDGRVKGVEVREKYRFPHDADGPSRNIKAKKAVVLATGGFGNDIAFRTMQDPRLKADLQSTNQPGATADGLREAIRIGCMPIQLSWIQLGPWGSPDERGFGLNPFFAQLCAAMFGIWVDTNTGKRFVNELADRKIRADAIIAAGNRCISMTDARGFAYGETLFGDKMAKLMERGVVRRFDNLEDLAAAYDCPIEPLKETVWTFNQSAAAGFDAEWGRYMQAEQLPLDTAPFYASRLAPKVHHTMGGVCINTKAQAIDIETNEPIAGLYCAGEVTGGVHGAVRLGSCATVDCLVFGRIAGRNAADEEAWS